MKKKIKKEATEAELKEFIDMLFDEDKIDCDITILGSNSVEITKAELLRRLMPKKYSISELIKDENLIQETIIEEAKEHKDDGELYSRETVYEGALDINTITNEAFKRRMRERKLSRIINN